MRKLRATGFTLMELLVVLMIIGIIAAVAVPKYQGLIANARISEAKIALSSVLKSEKIFFATESSYSACLAAIGFERPSGKTYYTVGFSSSTASLPTCGPSGLGSCALTIWDGSGSPCDMVEGSIFFRASTDAYSVNNFNRSNISPRTNSYVNVYSSITPNLVPNSILEYLSSNTFVMSATGAIADWDLSPMNNGNPNQPMEFYRKADIWTINQAGELLHVQDGTGSR